MLEMFLSFLFLCVFPAVRGLFRPEASVCDSGILSVLQGGCHS